MRATFNIAAFIIAGTICYFVIAHARLQNATANLQRARLARICTVDGERMFVQYKAHLLAKYDPNSLLDQPEFHYSTRLHTCIMKVGHWSMIPGTQAGRFIQDSDLLNEVVDVFANRTIISGGHTNRYDRSGNLKSELIGTNPHDFEDRAKVLMAE
jgi:hypothetical protein